MAKPLVCPKCGSDDLAFFTKRNEYLCDCGYRFKPEAAPYHPMRIFLSYGHDDNSALVERIKSDLEKRGHNLWIDFEGIKRGENWRSEITGGIRQSNLFFSFLSKHSTRDPGVCLDELSIALGIRSCVIKTVLLEDEKTVKAPVSVNHIQWCDMHDWKSHWNFKEHTPAADGWYEDKISEIICVVESDSNLKFLGELEELKDKMNPVLPDARMGFLLQKQFEGREWLAQDVNAWRLKDTDSRVLLLTGAPGVGKSSFAAWMAHFNKSNIIASHFIEYNKSDSKSPKHIVKSIAFQIACHLADFRKSLLKLSDINHLDDKNTNELFNYLLVDPLYLSIKGYEERYAVIIDALDEASDDSADSLVDVIAHEADKLPEWLTFVITSRPNPDILRRLSHLNPIQISTSDDRNKKDLRLFLKHWVDDKNISLFNLDDVVAKIIEASEGNFLYLKNFCAAVDAGWLNVNDTDCYPRGLTGMYFGYFKRQFPDVGQYQKQQSAVLELVVSAYEPLTQNIVDEILDWSEKGKIRLLDSLKSLFRWQGGTIEPFHKSLNDWLSTPEMSGEYAVSVLDGHKKLAHCGWVAYQDSTKKLNLYFLAWLPSHLFEAKEYDKLTELLKDFDFMMTRCGKGLLERLLDDYRLLVDCLPSELLSKLKTEKLFFQNKDHLLRQGHQEWPTQKILLQLAWEHAEESPLTEAAINWASSRKCNWGWLRKEHRPQIIVNNPCIKVINSSGQGLRCVAISPCNTMATTGGEDGVIVLWDLKSGRKVRQFEGHEAAVRSCPFSPAGDRLVSASYDGTVRLWDVESGKCLKIWKQHSDWVTGAAISSDGKLAISGSKDGTVRLWDLSSYRCRKIFKICESEIMAVSWFPDDTRFVCGTGHPDNKLSVWDIKNNKTSIIEFSEHSAPVRSVDVSKCGQMIVSGSYDNNVIVWDAVDYSPLCFFGKKEEGESGHTEWVRGVAFTSDAKFVVSVGNDKAINLWNVHLNKHEGIAEGHTGEIMGVVTGPDSQNILTCAAQSDNTLRMWNLECFSGKSECAGQSGNILATAMASDGLLVATGSGHPAGSIEIWNLLKGESQRFICDGLEWVTGLSFSADNAFLASGERDGRIQIWDVNKGVVESTGQEHNNRVLSLAFSPDNLYLVSGGFDGKINLWQRNPLNKLDEILGASGWVNCLAWGGNKRIAVGFNDGSIKLFEMKKDSLSTKIKFQAHQNPISSVIFSKNQLWFLTSDDMVGNYDLDSLECGEKTHRLNFAEKRPKLFKTLSPQSSTNSFLIDSDKKKIRLNLSPPVYWYGENISGLFPGRKINVMEKKSSVNIIGPLEMVNGDKKVLLDEKTTQNYKNFNNLSVNPISIFYSSCLLGFYLEQREDLNDEKFIEVQRALHLSNEDRFDAVLSVQQSFSNPSSIEPKLLESARSKIIYAFKNRLLPLRGPLYQWLKGLLGTDKCGSAGGDFP